MKKILFFLVSALFLVLLFWGGPGRHAPRSFNQAWNLGHIGCFFFWTYGMSRLTWFQKKSFTQQIFWAIFITVTFGGAIELLQTGTPRMPDLFDIGRDLVGTLMALAILATREKQLRPGIRILQITAALALLLCLSPLAAALVDETIAAMQFPLLADFESPLEKNRWGGKAGFTISDAHPHTGKRSLKIEYSTTRYSGVALQHFPGNWTGYASFNFSVFNREAQPLKLTCRIHDQLHEDGNEEYNDRFNKTFRLDPGWNHLTVSLQEIARAPRTRAMDLRAIQLVGFFVTKLPAPREIYLDSVRLL